MRRSTVLSWELVQRIDAELAANEAWRASFDAVREQLRAERQEAT